MIQRIVGLLCAFFSLATHAQVTGELFSLPRDRALFYLHYTPFSDTDNTTTENYQRYSTKIGLPALRTAKFQWYSTIGADIHRLPDITTTTPFTSNASLYSVNYSGLLRYSVAKNWSINALVLPHVNGAFQEAYQRDNLRFNGILFGEKRFNTRRSDRYFIVSFGVGYLTLEGKTTVNPVLNIAGSFSKKLSFAIGVPHSYIRYNFHPKHSVRAVGDLNDISVYRTANVAGKSVARKTIFTSGTVGVEYTYWLSKKFGLQVKGTTAVYEKYHWKETDDTIVRRMVKPFATYLSFGITYNPFQW